MPMSVRAMKAGAVKFLIKPFRDQDLLDAINQLERNRQSRQQLSQIAELRVRFDELGSREKEVMGLVAAGLLNKRIAGELGISGITVKIHSRPGNESRIHSVCLNHAGGAYHEAIT